MGKHPGTSRGADYMRGFTWGVKGEEVVMANLNKQLEGIKSRSMNGLKMAAAFIYKKTESEIPLTPVDTGNLRSSFFIVTPTSVVRGYGEKKFEGEDAAILVANHTATITEAQGIVAAQSVGKKKFLMLGYTAPYSGFVHEMIGANFNPERRKGKRVRREGAGAKWLESAIKRNTSKIVQIVKDNAQIKG
jgi:hypothetical protein